MLIPMYARAETFSEYTRDVEYLPSGDYDESQNRLDPNTETNFDTWDPVPSGVFVGGYSKESKFRLSMVPVDETSICLAQVVRFTAGQIMSGGSYVVVRMPMSPTYEYAWLDIYEIANDCNWTFEENITTPSGDHKRNNMRITFTTGNYSLLYFTGLDAMSPLDESPTNGNAYFTRSNRTYLEVRAPIHPDQFYLFVATIRYVADAYAEIYWSPDSLSMGTWNRSTLATYTLAAPDTPELEVDNFNISLGFSFDFREGFGNNVCGYNRYYTSGSMIRWFQKIETVNLNTYLNVMIPFEADLTNISFKLQVNAFLTDTADNDAVITDRSEWTDFILLSSDDVLDNIIPGGWKASWDGWLLFGLWVFNDTRIRFHTTDPDYVEPTGFSQDWYDDCSAFQHQNDVHAPGYRWDPTQYFYVNTSEPKYEDVFWQLECSAKLEDFAWAMSAPVGSLDRDAKTWDEMGFLNKLFYVTGVLTVVMGEYTAMIYPPWGNAVQDIGMTFIMIGQYIDFPTPFGDVWDGLNFVWDKLVSFGQWLWKVGQAIVGALTWFVETLVYYASIILGIIVLVLALVVLFLPIWASARVATMLVNVSRGRSDLAIADMESLAQKGSGMLKRGG